jgi:NodT family efflux transporter outer membrane factor (OMF) lipoprotein
MRNRLLLAVGLCALATGCTVGPDFHTPAPPAQTAYDREPLAPLAGPDGTQSWAPGAPDPQWWHLFASPRLDRLVDQALAANTDLAAAQAALRQAHELWLAQRGILLPTVDAGAGTSRNKSSQYLSPVPNDSSFTYGLQTAQVTVGYTLDIFGGNRRTVEQAHAQYDTQAFQTQATRISLINNVAAAAFQQASLADQVEAQQQIIALQAEIVEILRHQQAMGQAAGADVIAQQAQLAQLQQALPPLRHALAQSRDLIAYLTGRTAADAAEPDLRLADVTLPQTLPLSLPAEMVRQRPDIRAAQANLHAASAGVGIAIANRLPQLTLSASAGGNSAGWASLLSAANSFWSVGAGITQPIFAGGTLLHRQRAAKAAYEQADAQYRSTVLAAFQNVADTLAALRADADALTAAHAARDHAAATLAITEHQQAVGDVAGMAVLQARQSLLQADQALVQARAARLSDTAALFQALGGGLDAGAKAKG